MGPTRLRILEALVQSDGGLTDDEIQNELGISHQTCGPRRGELVKGGYVIRTDDQRRTRAGRFAAVYAAADPDALERYVADHPMSETARKRLYAVPAPRPVEGRSARAIEAERQAIIAAEALSAIDGLDVDADTRRALDPAAAHIARIDQEIRYGRKVPPLMMGSGSLLDAAPSQ